MAADLAKIGERERLKPRPGDEPHWQRLRFGAFVGFRPSQLGGKGTWFARAYDADTGKYRRKALGDFGALSGHDVFATAKREAEAWADVVETGGVSTKKLETVGDACREYAKGNAEAEARFGRYLYDDPLAKVKLGKLRRHHLEEWRVRLTDRPALVSRRKKGEALTRPRAPSTVNRDLVPLRAALTKILPPGAPGTPAAWQEALRPIRNADRQRTLYLDAKQRRAILAAIEAEAAPFIRALCLLPLRPGAMSDLSVSDFDSRTRELTIGEDKTGKPRRIILPATTAKFFADQVKGKSTIEPMFARANGKRWTRHDWNDPIREAAVNAEGVQIPAELSAYTFRHSVITDLVDGGLALLTVAQLSDTSVEMIERHYGHLNRTAAEHALALLAADAADAPVSAGTGGQDRRDTPAEHKPRRRQAVSQANPMQVGLFGKT